MSGTMNENAQASVDRVKQEVERWIEVARTAGERTLEAIGLSPGLRSGYPAVDVFETGESVHVWVDVPGLSSDGVQLSTTETQLTIKLFYPDPTGEPPKYFLRERAYRSSERTVPLPAAVKMDQTNAQLRDGVLHVTLAKQHVTESRSVPVTVVT